MPVLEFWNLHVKFGTNGNLLDHLMDIVYPALSDKEIIKTSVRGELPVTYRITDCSLDLVEGYDADGVVYDIPVIHGTFVKGGKLISLQYFDDGSEEIVQDARTLDDAEYAYFVIRLEDHRLIYMSDKPSYPRVSEFQSFLSYSLKAKWNQLIRSMQAAVRERGERVSLGSLMDSIGEPFVNIVPFVSVNDIEDQIQKFRSIRRLKYEIFTTNDEPLQGRFLIQIQERDKAIGGGGEVRTDVETTAPNGSLNKEAVAEEVREAAPHGQVQVEIRGTSAGGEAMTVTSEGLRVRKRVDGLPAEKLTRTKAALEAFVSLVREGTVTIRRAGDVLIRIRRLIGR